MLTYEQALQRADQRGGVPLRGAADMYVGMSAILRERDDLPSATALLRRSRELGEHAGLPQNPYRTLVAMAQIRQAEADPDGALDLLMQAERAYVSDFFPNVRPVPAMIARLRAATGQWAAALGWVRERGLSVDDDLDYLSEFEHITLARVLLARDRAEPAGSAGTAVLAFLERIRQAADAGGRAGAVIEADVLLAVGQQTRGELPAAFAALDSALALAEPEGYLRMFLDEGPPMVALLTAAANRGSAAGYVGHLLARLNTAPQAPEDLDREVRRPAKPGLIEPLSVRELQVLRLLGTDLDGPSIARQLYVSLNTVRSHTKNIYAKLGVTNRRSAVRRAAELDLT